MKVIAKEPPARPVSNLESRSAEAYELRMDIRQNDESAKANDASEREQVRVDLHKVGERERTDRHVDALVLQRQSLEVSASNICGRQLCTSPIQHLRRGVEGD